MCNINLLKLGINWNKQTYYQHRDSVFFENGALSIIRRGKMERREKGRPCWPKAAREELQRAFTEK
jgi:hypothetical protein